MENTLTKSEYLATYDIPGDYITDHNHPLALWDGFTEDCSNDYKQFLADKYIMYLGYQFDKYAENDELYADDYDTMHQMQIQAQEFTYAAKYEGSK